MSLLALYALGGYLVSQVRPASRISNAADKLFKYLNMTCRCWRSTH